MNYLIKDTKLELKYQPGKGAWTYHLQIPNTKHIIGKWGSLKVSGFIDDYKVESINLFTITGQDKIISVNDRIRKAINKTGGDAVIVTLFLLTKGDQISELDIFDTFEESGVLTAFKRLSADERNEIFGKIISQQSEESQTKMIVNYIDTLIKKSSSGPNT